MDGGHHGMVMDPQCCEGGTQLNKKQPPQTCGKPPRLDVTSRIFFNMAHTLKRNEGDLRTYRRPAARNSASAIIGKIKYIV